MPIRFACQFCQARVKVPDGSQGKRMKCPRCGKVQVVPAESSPLPIATATAAQTAPAPLTTQAPAAADEAVPESGLAATLPQDHPQESIAPSASVSVAGSDRSDRAAASDSDRDSAAQEADHPPQPQEAAADEPSPQSEEAAAAEEPSPLATATAAEPPPPEAPPVSGELREDLQPQQTAAEASVSTQAAQSGLFAVEAASADSSPRLTQDSISAEVVTPAGAVPTASAAMPPEPIPLGGRVSGPVRASVPSPRVESARRRPGGRGLSPVRAPQRAVRAAPPTFGGLLLVLGWVLRMGAILAVSGAVGLSLEGRSFAQKLLLLLMGLLGAAMVWTVGELAVAVHRLTSRLGDTHDGKHDDYT